MKAEGAGKLKPIFKAIPAFIIWQIWKRRNVIKHEGNMTKHSIIMEIYRNIYLFTKFRYPWLKETPKTWTIIVQFLEGYSTLISYKIVR